MIYIHKYTYPIYVYTYPALQLKVSVQDSVKIVPLSNNDFGTAMCGGCHLTCACVAPYPSAFCRLTQ